MRPATIAHRRSGRQRGQVLLLVTFSLVAMVGIMGLACDLGYARFVRWQAQAAADAAAIAAADATLAAFGQTATIVCGSNAVCQAATACPSPVNSPPITNLDNACLYAQQNGFTTGGVAGHQSVNITSNITTTPPTAAGVNVSYWVEVQTQQTIPQFFSSVLGNTMATVTAQATAAIVGNSANPCVYALDPTAKGAVTVSGGSSVSVDCGIDVNSSDKDAMDVSGGSTVNAAAVNITGGFKANGGATISPAPATGVNPVANPFAGLNPPAVSVCDFTGWKLNGGNTATLNPAVYCDGIDIEGGSTATFNPGTYILRGGGLKIAGGSNAFGSGVTFYNTADGYGYKPIDTSGGSSVVLSAPTSGPLAGILFFQDPSIVDGNSNNFTGGATMQLTGVLYFPTTPLMYSGGSSTNWTYTTIVADTVKFTGGSYFHNYNILQGGLSARFAGIVQ